MLLTNSKNKLSLRFFYCSLSLLVFSICSCVSAVRPFDDTNSYVYQGDFDEARMQLEFDKDLLYKDTDLVLYELDSGILSHYAGLYEQSNSELSDAEKAMEAAFTKSISQAIGSYIVNDNLVDYPGEEYEDIYTNVFMALNYLHLGSTEDAFVEIRRFDNKLKNISLKYAAAIQSAALKAKENNLSTDTAYSSKSLTFHNSALARYISMIMYYESGDIDSAIVDKKYIQSAFQNQVQLYNFPIPTAVDNLFVPRNSDLCTLHFVSLNGKAPYKEEDVFRTYNENTGSYFKLSLPVLIARPSSVYTTVARVVNENGEVIASIPLEKIESIENIAFDTFQQRQAFLYIKTFLRAMTKTTSSSVITNAFNDGLENSDSGPWLGTLFQLASSIAIETTEQADLRTSQFLPNSVFVGNVAVPPGNYGVSVEYYNQNGILVYVKDFTNIEVSHGNINLVESICLK
jgi:hypothetical protein